MQSTSGVFAIINCAVIVACAQFAKCEDVVGGGENSFYFDLPEHSYKSVVTAQQIAESPQWLPSDDNPPTSARQAMRVAMARLRQLVEARALSSLDWKVRSVSLQQWDDETWYWVVSIDAAHRSGGSSLYNASIIVLMNGQAAEVREINKH
ncbi:MAG TPA: hypothetical protein P5307_23230 [Pirellulaceae bacterium]|nr:hypothetical protein [Pirellulaceae bacterium]